MQPLQRKKDIGQVAPGVYADVIASSNGNLLDDVAVLRKVDFVIKGGVAYKMPTALP